MDTSIIVVIAIVVVFAVAVPAMIRKSATELSRAEIDAVPTAAEVVPAETPIPGHDHSERTQVFHAKPRRSPTVPAPNVSRGRSTPMLRLSAQVPALSVIDGQAEGTDTGAEADAHTQVNVMPMAVGQTRSPLFSADATTAGTTTAGATTAGTTTAGATTAGATTAEQHAVSAAPGIGMSDNVRTLHPAVQAVFNDSSQPGPTRNQTDPTRNQTGPTRHQPGPTRHRISQSPAAGGQMRSMTGTAAGGGSRSGRDDANPGGRLGGGAKDSTERGAQISNPNVGADEGQSMTEQATTLRESMSSLATMVRGFALLFLASVLGILVTGVLTLFSVGHIALAGVFLGLAVVSLFIVRSLNLRKREVKKRLRRLEQETKAEVRRESAAKAGAEVASKTGAAAAPATSVRAETPAAPTAKPAATPGTTTTPTSAASVSSGTAARIAAAAQASARSTRSAQVTGGSTKAAQARAAMQHTTSAKKAREEADTGEIPLVRIRKEDAEGHTTRQVLLTGPIPVVEEKTAAAGPESEETSETATETSVRAPIGRDRPDSLGSDLAADESESVAAAEDTAADEDVQSALKAAAPKVDDPFMQRLKSRDGWSPTPLPVPSYVDAPAAESPAPKATAADASSYETEARSREEIAAEFAAELGYRPELSDSAREDGPLEHGRKAIRTTKSADLSAVNDVLARRRA